MPAIQTTYTENIKVARVGQIANSTPHAIDTREVETSAGIGFGLACGQGTADDGVVLGASAGDKFVGVSVKDPTRTPDDDDKYIDGANAAIMTRGDVWVEAAAAVIAGDDVVFNSTTGALSSQTVISTRFAITGARWMTSAAANGLAVLRLSGELPSA